jgi:glucokinase
MKSTLPFPQQAETAWVVAADLGASKVALGLIAPGDRIVAWRRMPTNADEGPQAVVERIARQVAELERELPPASKIAALGICTPGPVDHETGMLIEPPNLTGWRNVPFRQMLAERLGIPVALEHDAKAAALGEFHYGAGRGEQSMMFIVVGTGVGGASIINGELYRGLSNTAGEIGHITLDPDGELCSCGNRGCVETFVSGPALARHYRRALEGTGRSPEGSEPITGEVVAHLAREGDPLALQVIEKAGQALGTAIASAAMLLDINLYVVGSSVAKCGDLLLEPARRAVPRHAYPSVARRVRIVPSELCDDAPLFGCGWLARQLVGIRGEVRPG